MNEIACDELLRISVINFCVFPRFLPTQTTSTALRISHCNVFISFTFSPNAFSYHILSQLLLAFHPFSRSPQFARTSLVFFSISPSLCVHRLIAMTALLDFGCCCRFILSKGKAENRRYPIDNSGNKRYY